MKDYLNRFMYGRYGNDDLNKTLLLGGVIFSLISFFAFPKLFTVLAYTMLFSALYRFFSRKVQDRYQENQSFLSWKNREAIMRLSMRMTFEFRFMYFA